MSSYLRALRLVNFRNYADATVLLAPGLNIVVGDNAQGKTNLLEAISFAVTGSTPRTPNDPEVVRWGEDFARTEMRVSLDGGSAGEERKVAVGYAPGQKKRLTVDGAPAPSLTAYAAGGVTDGHLALLAGGASVQREDLIDTLRRVNLFAQRQTPPVPVTLDFSEGAVEVTVRNGEVGEARERLPAGSEDEFHISFNPTYLLDGVSAVDSEKVLFRLNESLKPGLIVPGGSDDGGSDGEEPDFLYLIMPMRDPSRS